MLRLWGAKPAGPPSSTYPVSSRTAALEVEAGGLAGPEPLRWEKAFLDVGAPSTPTGWLSTGWDEQSQETRNHPSESLGLR